MPNEHRGHRDDTSRRSRTSNQTATVARECLARMSATPPNSGNSLRYSVLYLPCPLWARFFHVWNTLFEPSLDVTGTKNAWRQKRRTYLPLALHLCLSTTIWGHKQQGSIWLGVEHLRWGTRLSVSCSQKMSKVVHLSVRSAAPP